MQMGTVLCTYHGHTDIINKIAWSPDGKYIASASSDQTIQVWDAGSGQTLFTYRDHSENVYTVSWSPDGSRIASMGKQATREIWQAPE